MRRRAVFSSTTVLLLLALAVLLGVLTDRALTQLEKHLYPTDFSEYVELCAEQYDIDSAIIYAIIKETSNFSSNHVAEDGKIGLMQLSPDTFRQLTQEHLHEDLHVGMLYDPQTNIRYGCYYLLTLTAEHEDWEQVFIAYLEQDDALQAQKRAKDIQRTVEKYHELYHKKEKTS